MMGARVLNYGSMGTKLWERGKPNYWNMGTKLWEENDECGNQITKVWEPNYENIETKLKEYVIWYSLLIL